MGINFKKIVDRLDSELGTISLKVAELEAIESNLGSVMEQLESIDPSDVVKTNIIIYDVYPTLKIIESLLRYSVKELSNKHKKTNELNNELFKLIFDYKNE